MKALYILLVSILLITSTQAQEIYQIEKSESSILIKGTSSLHDWESVAEEFDGAASFLFEEGKLTNIEALSFSVLTESIKSGKRIMDNKTKDALDAKKNPSIIFSFLSIDEVTEDSITVTGSLKLAGVTKEISLTSAYMVSPNSNITVSGVETINMQDYGVNPPTAMMGTLKTGGIVDVEFKITFSKK